MKARRFILTAGVVVALAGPATQPAGAMYPGDGGGSRPKSVALKELKQARAAQATAIRVGAYNAHAYVRGGASPAVAKAITKAGKRPAKATAPAPTPRVNVAPPGLRGNGTGPVGGWGWTGGVTAGDPDACQQYSICTDLELCTIWGLGCLLIESQPPPVEISAPVQQLQQIAAPAGGDDEAAVKAPSDPYDTSYLYQDC